MLRNLSGFVFIYQTQYFNPVDNVYFEFTFLEAGSFFFNACKAMHC